MHYLFIGSQHYNDMLTRANELDIPVVIINLLMTYFTDKVHIKDLPTE